MQVYIVSNKGFLKSFDLKDPFNMIFLWSEHVRDAVIFQTKSSAKQFIDTKKIDAFLWSPYTEELIKEQYEIVQNGEWIYKEVFIINSDLKFLNNMSDINKYYTLDEAKKIVTKRNLELFETLKIKLNIE